MFEKRSRVRGFVQTSTLFPVEFFKITMALSPLAFAEFAGEWQRRRPSYDGRSLTDSSSTSCASAVFNVLTHFPEFPAATQRLIWWGQTGKCWRWKLRSLWSDCFYCLSDSAWRGACFCAAWYDFCCALLPNTVRKSLHCSTICGITYGILKVDNIQKHPFGH